MYTNFILWSHRMKNPHLYQSDTQLAISRFMPREDEDKLKPFPKFLLMCLIKLYKKKYRRFKGAIYEPIYTEKGFYTNAWRYKESIDDFVWGVASIDVDGYMFNVMF